MLACQTGRQLTVLWLWCVCQVWSIKEARTVKTLEGSPSQELIGHIEISKDNRTLVGLSRTTIFVWDVELRRLHRAIEMPSKDPSYSLFHPLKVSVSADWKWMTVRADFGNTIKVIRRTGPHY